MNRYSEIHIIVSVVEGKFNLAKGSLQIDTRKREILDARQIAMYFCVKLLKYSQVVIGSQFAERDHSTVSHARSVINDRLDTEKEFKEEMTLLEADIISALNHRPLLSHIFMLGFGVWISGKKSKYTHETFNFDTCCFVAVENGFNPDLISCYLNCDKSFVEVSINSANEDNVLKMINLLNKMKNE